MRVVFLTYQLVVAGALFLLVAVPLYIMVSGLAYALVVATEMVFTAFAMGAAEVIISSLPPLFPSMSGSAGAAPTLTTIAAGTSHAATILLVVAAPWLLSLALNIICVFLAPYRDWFARMRRWAIIGTMTALACYLLPQLALIVVLSYEAFSPPHADLGAALGGILAVALLFLAWDSYFFISLALLRRMPRYPDAPRIMRSAPAAQLCLCVALVAGFAVLLAAMGSSLGRAAIIIACVIFCLSALLLLGNARAARRIAAEKRKLLFLYAFLRTAVPAALCLALFPPVGVLLALSAAFLYFLMEAVFLNKTPSSATTTADSVQAEGAV